MEKTAGKQNKAEVTTRPPIVVVMGHIDHGKTKILDWYRKTKVVEEESGGITQAIGAYEVEHKGKKITFIDTPGHEAFSKMRSRGAKVADIAVLVVAADDGVKPQTKEAIGIAVENKLPFAVAINKIDKSEANPERAKQQLAEESVLVESYGGKIPSVEISAKDGKNMDALLETILLLAELEELRSDPGKRAQGVVIEAHLDSRRGITATLLVRDGTLRKGDVLAVGRAVETIKILEDFKGHPVKEAGPSSPVLISGLSQTPTIGDAFSAHASRGAGEKFVSELAPEKAEEKGAPVAAGGKPIFNIILKADVAGSCEAIEESLRKLESEVIGIKIIRSGVGDINESDVKMAQATKLVTIVGFKVKVDPAARDLADISKIRIATGEVIYDLLDRVKEKMIDMIPPEVKRTYLGKIKILKTFKHDDDKQIIGGRVEEGVIKKEAKCDIKRAKELIGGGIILELQREKIKADEVAKGNECGMLVESKVTIQEGDVLEVYEEEIIKRTL